MIQKLKIPKMPLWVEEAFEMTDKEHEYASNALTTTCIQFHRTAYINTDGSFCGA